jgi:TRAP-type C4-dicarboxylate transport system permease small subunit
MHRAVHELARLTAILGGLVLIGIIVMTTMSIVGRSLNRVLHSDWVESTFGMVSQRLIDMGIGEIRGNYELLEAGVAFAIFSFFPICQLHTSHATVDVFTARLPERITRVIMAFWEVALTACLIFISLRLYEGMQRYIGNGETTLFLQFPVWWAYFASFAACCVTCVVAVYCAVMRIGESVTGRMFLPRA